MADNLAKGSKNLEGKGGSLEGGKKLKIRKNSKETSNTDDGATPKVGVNKISESGKGSGAR